MNICEGCIKQDVCKFKKQVGEYVGEMRLPEPLAPTLECQYKRTEPSNWTYTVPHISAYTTICDPYCGDDLTLTSGTAWCGDDSYRC